MSTSIEVKNIEKSHSKTVPVLVTELLWCLETIFLVFAKIPFFMRDSGVSRQSTRRSRAKKLHFSARFETKKVRSWSLCRFRASHSGDHGFLGGGVRRSSGTHILTSVIHQRMYLDTWCTKFSRKFSTPSTKFSTTT